MRAFTNLALIVGLVAPSCMMVAAADERRSAPWVDARTVRALDTCIANERPIVDAEPSHGLVDVRGRCPLVYEWLQTEEREQRLVLGSITKPNHNSLLELRRLFSSGKRLDGPLHRSALDSVLAGLSFDDEPELGWWKRFMTWLSSHYKSSDVDLHWLDELIETLTPSKSMLEFLFKGSLLLLVLMAVLLVGNEVRLFGWRGRAPGHRATGVAPGGGSNAIAQWEELNALPPRQQISAALQLLVQAASETRAVGAQATGAAAARSRPESRTPRELLLLASRSSSGSDRAQSGAINQLVTQVESVIYGDEQLDQSQAGTLLARCRQVAQTLLITSGSEQHTGKEPAKVERGVTS